LIRNAAFEAAHGTPGSPATHQHPHGDTPTQPTAHSHHWRVKPLSLPSSGLSLGLLIIPILAFLIIIHELGHFWSARSVGVTVEEFGIGIPPRAKGWRRKGVLWSINWIPFGGFVRVKGEDGADMSPGSMNAKGPLQRAFFLAAGSTMNFIAAIVLSILIVAFQGIPETGSSVFIAEVVAKSPAESAGWLPGDAIVAVDGQPVSDGTSLHGAISDHTGSPVNVTIRRDEQRIETTVTPRQDPPEGQGATGISIADGQRSILRVTDVAPGSFAAEAGWRPGDEIVAIDGARIESGSLSAIVLSNNIGETISVTLERAGQPVETSLTVPAQDVLLTQVANDSPASDALLYANDQVVSINGKSVEDASGFLDLLEAVAGSTAPIEVLRDGQTISTNIAVPALEEDQTALEAIGANAQAESPYDSIGADGVYARIYNDVSALRIIPEGWNQFWAITSGTFAGLKQMATEGVDQDALVGPVGMGQMTSELLSQSAAPAWVTLSIITVVISVALGVLNLMPLPALDGGRLLFVLVEVLRGGRRISPEKEGLVHLAGMVVLLGLMFYVAFGDVSRILDGRSIFP